MISLREAAEQALEALRNAEVVYMEQLDAMYALQKALEEPESKEYEEGFRAGLEAAKNAIVGVEERA